MKARLIATLGCVAIVAMPALVISEGGCTPGQREAARSALDIVQVACVIAHQALPDSEVAKVCGITQPFLDPMKEVLASSRLASAQQVAAARVGAGACAPCGASCADAGARDAGGR